VERWAIESGRTFPWRSWRDLYRVTVTEVLLQRTQSKTVRRLVDAFFERFPNWESIATTSPEELRLHLEPFGLYRRRAAVIHSLAIDPPESIQTLEQRAGVGQYISRAVRVSISNDRVAMVDTNFVRLLQRMFAGPWKADYRYDNRLQRLAEAVVAGATSSRSVNWAVLDLGAKVCRARRPACGSCPLRSECHYARTGSIVA